MIGRNLVATLYSWILFGAAAATPARGFPIQRAPAAARQPPKRLLAATLDLRGGENFDNTHSTQSQHHQSNEERSSSVSIAIPRSALEASVLPMSSIIAALANFYMSQVRQAPIRTKSLTAGLIFGLSDYLAQRLESPRKPNQAASSSPTTTKSLDAKRLWTSVGVGLLYYGPAAHFWYDFVFRIMPGTNLASTLQKAALGQVLFGPAFTCVFFAASLWRSKQLTLSNWVNKIRNDLPGAWMAGLGFWPLVDLVSYSLIPKDYIPLFVNACSLVWTVYLSLVANR
jgi:protein Mpv17